MKTKLLFSVLFFVSIFIGIQSKAQNADSSKIDVLIEMNLEDLISLDVTTVSKKAQKLSEAPAVITIIKAEQIENLGVQSLTELMSFVPGFSVADSYWKRQIVTSRGIKMTLYNDKILMLINGVPAYDAASLEYYLDVIPITSIKQIEIIRGPGSTLYGTNAFSAVINVITKNGKDNRGATGYVKGGSFGTKEVGVSVDNYIGQVNYHIGATIKDDDGYIKTIEYDESKMSGKSQYEHDNDNIFALVNYKDFSLNAGYMFQKYFKYGPLPALQYSNNQSIGTGGRTFTDKVYANLIWDKKYNDKLSAKASLHFDNSDHMADIGKFGLNIYKNLLKVIDTSIVPDYYRFAGYLMEGEAMVSYIHSDALSFMGGINGEMRTTTHLADLYTELDGDKKYEGSTQKLPYTVQDYGAFLQLDGKLKKLGYVAGVRATYIGVSEKVFITPRAGLVYSLDSSSSIKLLYGEAFRGPGPQEQFYKVPILIYGADAYGRKLKPELIRTLELAWEQSIKEKYKFKINGFYTNIYDVINRRSATPEEIAIINQPGMTSTSVYDNLGKQTIYGGEAEFIIKASDHFSFFCNVGYKDGKVSDIPSKSKYTNKDTLLSYDYIPFAEKISGSAGLSVKIKNFVFSPNCTYVGTKEGDLANNAIAPKYTPFQHVSAGDYFLLNAQLSYEFNKNLVLSVYARNILDKEYYYPEDVRRRIPYIPGGPGRSFFLKLNYTFAKK